MKAIDPAAWIPADKMTLEENAQTAIKNPDSILVVAGPGAGKTELLAQKACYLLQTNICRYPRKILAISFKRDAAYNLKGRVKKRAGSELSRRFDSFTFDAFSKLIVDQFHNALPEFFKIKKGYKIIFGEDIIKDHLKGVDEEYYYTTRIKCYDNWLTGGNMRSEDGSREDLIRLKVWKSLIGGSQSLLTFKMIMKLATWIMDTKPRVRRFLQQTYSHVFLDEFQDTTYKQYEFLRACFADSSVNYTAVGDDKQRIMGWAGAIPDIFAQFIKDANATRLPLKMNFRSAPKLVTLQNHLVKELLAKTEESIPSSKWRPDQGKAIFHYFDDYGKEGIALLEYVKQWIEVENVDPRDICILVKQKLAVYADNIILSLRNGNIVARNEEKYQDFLTEEIVQYIASFIHYIFNPSAINKKQIVFDMTANLHSTADDNELLRVHHRIASFKEDSLKKFGKAIAPSNLEELITQIVDFAGVDRFKAVFPQYKQGSFLNDKITQFGKFLNDEMSAGVNIISALDVVEGKNAIPIMTIHKSKGLEYHTVVFVGLEDAAFWSYRSQPEEDKNAFFVALSRAKERVIFTFSRIRNIGGEDETQTLVNIREMFEKLQSSEDVEIRKN